MKKRGELHPFPGQVLDFDALPEGAVIHPGQRVRHADEVWTVDELPHCFDNLPTLLRGDGEDQVRWCSVCGPVAVGECIAAGDFDD